jgi:NAD(P)-dependent dehydrogenase (short-subunit alcohol dehydrogenase family)
VSEPATPLYNFEALGFVPGELVVVTGAASGIGRATALCAARSGLTVALWDMNGPGALATAGDISEAGGLGFAVTVDVFDEAQVERAWRETLAKGGCRYLVNNAGPPSVTKGPFGDLLRDALGSMERVTSHWLDHCGEQAAALVNIASIAGTAQGSGKTVSSFYPASKAGITGYTRWLATHHDGRPRANAVAPGITVTPRIAPMLELPAMQDLATRVPVGRLGQPEDIAHAVLFLLSPAASYINGVVLPVDGGVTLA